MKEVSRASWWYSWYNLSKFNHIMSSPWEKSSFLIFTPCMYWPWGEASMYHWCSLRICIGSSCTSSGGIRLLPISNFHLATPRRIATSLHPVTSARGGASHRSYRCQLHQNRCQFTRWTVCNSVLSLILGRVADVSWQRQLHVVPPLTSATVRPGSFMKLIILLYSWW